MRHTVCVIAVLACITQAFAAEPLRRDPARDPVIGINIWHVHAQPAGVDVVVNQIERMHRMGFAAVTILPAAFVNLQTGEVTPNDPTPNARFGGFTDAELSAAIRRAKELGMFVTVSITLEAADRKIFRGHIAFNDPLPGLTDQKPDNGVDSPENEARFWAGYIEQINRFAAIAQSAGADRINVGAEMQALDTDDRNAAHWGKLIDAADEIFKGEIGYTAVHSTFDSPQTCAMIWANPKIDYISLSAYFDLATKEQSANSGAPGDSQFANIVRDNLSRAIEEHVLPTAKKFNKKATLNEIGVIPFDGTTAQPWNWEIGDRAPNDPAEARNAFEGIFRAVAGRKETISNVNLWVWGWPGGFVGERFYINDDPVDWPATTNFDESQMKQSVEFIREYLHRRQSE